MSRRDITYIIGAGEIGLALSRVLRDVHTVQLFDKHEPQEYSRYPIDVMHICFPYDENFADEVRIYNAHYQPKQLVIHSTVKPGTSVLLGASHSPVIGIHPHLEQSLRAFTKFIGGPNASQVATHFMRAGIRVRLFDKAETTELMKILSTMRYGLDIEYTKYVKHLCGTSDVPFEALSLWTQNYNDGYTKLGHGEYVRPDLVAIDGQIGGHCILPNLDLLPDSEFTRLIKGRNRGD